MHSLRTEKYAQRKCAERSSKRATHVHVYHTNTEATRWMRGRVPSVGGTGPTNSRAHSAASTAGVCWAPGRTPRKGRTAQKHRHTPLLFLVLTVHLMSVTSVHLTLRHTQAHLLTRCFPLSEISPLHLSQIPKWELHVLSSERRLIHQELNCLYTPVPPYQRWKELILLALEYNFSDTCTGHFHCMLPDTSTATFMREIL